MTQVHSNQIDAVMELMIQQGPDAMVEVFRRRLNLAMKLEREQFLGAGQYERVTSRRGCGGP